MKVVEGEDGGDVEIVGKTREVWVDGDGVGGEDNGNGIGEDGREDQSGGGVR